jgi:hypothetical protein
MQLLCYWSIARSISYSSLSVVWQSNVSQTGAFDTCTVCVGLLCTTAPPPQRYVVVVVVVKWLRLLLYILETGYRDGIFMSFLSSSR